MKNYKIHIGGLSDLFSALRILESYGIHIPGSYRTTSVTATWILISDSTVTKVGHFDSTYIAELATEITLDDFLLKLKMELL